MSSDPFSPTLLSADNPLMPRLYQAAIGPLHTAYYQQQFERFDALGKPVPSWNWAAGFCTLGWMALRGLWRPAAIYAAVVALVAGLWWWLDLHSLLPQSLAWALLLLLVLIAVVIPGLGGNALYHHDVRTRTMRVLTQSRTLTEAMTQLQTQAPTPTQLQWAATGHALAALLVAGVLWVLAGNPPATAPAAQPSATATVMRTQEDTARALAALAPSAPASTTPTSATPSDAPAPDATTATAPVPSAPAPPSPTLPATAPALDSPAPTAVVAPAPSAAAATAPPAKAPAPVQIPAKAEPASKAAKAEKSEKTDKGDKPAKADKAPKTEAKRPASASTSLVAGKYYLNSGIYAQPDNARRAARQLRGAELPVFTQQLESRKGEVTRVRIGPFDSRAQAEAAALKAHNLKLEAQIFRFSGE